MSSVIRIGTVSKVNYEDGTIEVASERSGMRITSRSVERNNVTGMTTTIRRAKPLNNTMEIAETMKKKSTGMQKRPSVKIWTSLLVGT